MHFSKYRLKYFFRLPIVIFYHLALIGLAVWLCFASLAAGGVVLLCLAAMDLFMIIACPNSTLEASTGYREAADQRYQKGLERREKAAIRAGKVILRPENIRKAVLLEAMQQYGTRVETVSSEKLLDFWAEDYRQIRIPITQPAGVAYTFSVTFADGSRRIVKAMSGTAADLLLQFCYDPPTQGGE